MTPSKDVLITGAAGGIGQATVRLLVQKGYRVFAADLPNASWDGLPEDPRLLKLYLDVTKPGNIAKCLELIQAETDGLDALVNNAGVFDQFPLSEADPARFEHLLAVNLLGPMRMVQACFPLLAERKGRVIQMSSESALVPMPMQVYGMSKRMLDVYSETLRQELALLGMQLVVIRPGAHRTAMIERTRQVLADIPIHSRYRSILEKMGARGLKVMEGMRHHDPLDVARVVLLAISSAHPKRTYDVHVSTLFRLLPLLPSTMRGWMVRKALE